MQAFDMDSLIRRLPARSGGISLRTIGLVAMFAPLSSRTAESPPTYTPSSQRSALTLRIADQVRAAPVTLPKAPVAGLPGSLLISGITPESTSENLTTALDLAFGSKAEEESALTKIFEMPKVIVLSRKSPPQPQELQTKFALQLLFLDRYSGASFKNQDPVNSVLPNYAAMMYRDDLRLERIGELSRLTRLMEKTGFDVEAALLKKKMDGIFIRKLNWREEGMDKSANSWRR